MQWKRKRKGVELEGEREKEGEEGHEERKN
jgi:hypothetical protein